jgi:hypothetical protein
MFDLAPSRYAMETSQDDRPDQFGRFDQVRLLTTRNVKWLSAPPGIKPSPKGIWSVAASVGESELLLVQGSVTLRIPAADVLKVADYSIEAITRPLGKLTDGKRKREAFDPQKPQRTQKDDLEGTR